MASPAKPPAPRPVPVTPSAEAWQAMSEPARTRFVLEVIDALSDPSMSEEREARARLAAVQAQAEQAMAGMRATLLGLLEALGLPCPEDVRAQILACAELPVLQRWLVRAVTARSAEEVVAATGAGD
jgi:hypothetical protein